PSLARNFWDTKKITLVNSTLETASAALDELRAGTTAAPIALGETPALPAFLTIPPEYDLAVYLGYCFEFPELDDGPADHRPFLRGGPPAWPTIRDHHDATREITDDIVAQLLVAPQDEPANPTHGATKFVHITGHGGSGKTTVARRAAWD